MRSRVYLLKGSLGIHMNKSISTFLIISIITITFQIQSGRYSNHTHHSATKMKMAKLGFVQVPVPRSTKMMNTKTGELIDWVGDRTYVVLRAAKNTKK